jgi:prepilin-type N-terminal cleavage/methylation domain-containing protein
MSNEQKHSGFSLTEVLIAVGILSVGMAFIAGVFPAGIYLMTVATERTIAAVAADEAFAKIEIYARCDPGNQIRLDNLVEGELRPNENATFNNILPAMNDPINDPCEFLYPSIKISPGDPCQQYYWSALCRRVGSDPNRLVQVTVFVCRKTGPNLKYPAPPVGVGLVDWPIPVRVGVSGGGNELTINSGYETYINDGYTIVDDATGRIYRVLERYKPPNDFTILLDRNWDGSSPGGLPQNVWVVPPPVGGGRYPCIAVYQKVIRF